MLIMEIISKTTILKNLQVIYIPDMQEIYRQGLMQEFIIGCYWSYIIVESVFFTREISKTRIRNVLLSET